MGFRNINRGLYIIAAFLPFGVPVSTSSSMPIAITVIDDEPKKNKDLSKECRAILSNKNKFLSKVAKRKIADGIVHDYFDGLYLGQYDCPKDQKLAHQILDQHVGYPIRKTVFWFDIERLLSNHHEALSTQRITDLRGQLFIRTRSGATKVPEYWTMSEIEQLLIESNNWRTAADTFSKDQAFVRNTLRDKLLIKNLLDPRSSIYDVDMAAELVSGSSRYSYRTQVAQHLLERKRNEIDLRTAFELMRWYSPFVERKISQEDNDIAASTFSEIIHQMGASNELDLQALSDVIQRTGNPHAEISRNPLDNLTDIKNDYLTVSWPDKFGKLLTIRSPSSYPSRARRDRVGGRVQAAAMFNSDGFFDRMIIMSSSGREDLDRATAKNLQRFNKLKSKKLPNFKEEFVLIPMPPIEWHILDETVAGKSGVFELDSKVKVVSKVIRPTILE